MRVWKLFAGLVLTMSAGCVNTDVIVQKQGEMERRLEAVAQSGALHSQRIDELVTQVGGLQQAQRATLDELESLKKSLQALRADMALQARPKGGDVSRIEVVNRDEGDRTGPPEGYLKAFALFSASDYEGAIAGFESFIHASPDSEYAGNARYWIGECHYARREYDKARLAFQTVIDSYPSSGKVPDAMLKVAYSLLAQNDKSQGIRILNELIRRYPDTQAAAGARERLNTINGSKR
jgi:tol-pal system protein YbgF